MHKIQLAILVAVCVPFTSAFASGAADSTDESVRQTQEVLRDPSKRKDAIQTNDAKNADAAALSVGGSQANADKMYEISADLMPLLAKESGGDPDKMMKILAEAQKNPEAFLKRWPPEQRAALQKLVQGMDDKGAATKKVP